MCWWDDQLTGRLNVARIEMFLYKRYVDDINMCVEVIKAGMKWNGEEIVFDPTLEEGGKDKDDDKRTFDIIKQIGNSIHRSIQLEVDVPSSHDDKKIPILDLKVWVERTVENGCSKRRIMHEFYMKEVSSKFLIDANSSLTWSSKITIVTQQCLRVMLNCSPDITKEVRIGHLDAFMKRMQASGYIMKHIYNVIKSAFNAYDKIKQDEIDGIRPMYRRTTWEQEERRSERNKKRNKWYGDYESVIFVPATPKSELKKLYDNEIKKRGIRIKVVERSGTKVKDFLQKKSTLNDKQCTDDCFICTTSGKGNCMASGITYKLECNSHEEEYKYQYDGRTMKNGYARGREHLNKLEKKHEDSVLWKHCEEEHNGEIKEFSMSVSGRCKDDATLIQIMEAIQIRNQALDNKIISMNDRNEWGNIRIPHAEIRD